MRLTSTLANTDATVRVRILNAKAWEGRPVVLRQIENLGEKSIKVAVRPVILLASSHIPQVLVQNGITSLEKLRAQDPIRLEAVR